MKILVAGGAGFIGSHLVDALVQDGHEVVVVDNLSHGLKENINPAASFYKADIRDAELENIFKKEQPEVVFNLAANISVFNSIQDAISDAHINILGMLNVLDQCKKYSAKKIIFSSSGGAVYSDTNRLPAQESDPISPLTPYGVSKASAEKYLKSYFRIFGLPYLALRLSNVYGPRQGSGGEGGVVSVFMDRLLNQEPVHINGDGEQTRDYIFVRDVVDAFRTGLHQDQVGIYNIATGVELSVNEIFNKINELMDNAGEKVHLPAKPGDQKRSCLSYSKAKKELGWQPKHSIERGLKETHDWFKKSRLLKK